MQIAKIGVLNKVKYNFSNSNTKNVRYWQYSQDSFEKSNEISFKANMNDVIKYSVDWGYEHFILPTVTGYDVYYPKQKKLNILHGDKDHLKDIAESLCMYSDNDIVNFSKTYYPLRFDVNFAKSKKAFNTIFPYILDQRTKVANLIDIKEALEEKREQVGLTDKEENGLQYTIEELERIDKKCREAKNKYLTSEHVEVSDESDKSWQID